MTTPVVSKIYSGAGISSAVTSGPGSDANTDDRCNRILLVVWENYFTRRVK